MCTERGCYWGIGAQVQLNWHGWNTFKILVSIINSELELEFVIFGERDLELAVSRWDVVL